jgi:hypothetical protein
LKPLGASSRGITWVTTSEGFSSPDTTLGTRVGLQGASRGEDGKGSHGAVS